MGSLIITSNPRLLIQKYNGWVMLKGHILPLVVLLGLMTPQFSWFLQMIPPVQWYTMVMFS